MEHTTGRDMVSSYIESVKEDKDKVLESLRVICVANDGETVHTKNLEIDSWYNPRGGRTNQWSHSVYFKKRVFFGLFVEKVNVLSYYGGSLKYDRGEWMQEVIELADRIVSNPSHRIK